MGRGWGSISMRLLEYIRRLITDKRVDCTICGTKIGYVGAEGHKEWICESCAGEIRAVRP